MLSRMAADAGDGAGSDEAGRVPRRRWWLVSVAAILVLAAVVGVLVAVDSGADPAAPRNRTTEALATAASWLRAWEADDRDALRSLIDQQGDGAGELTRTFDEIRSLRPSGVRGVAGFPALGDDVPFDVEIELPGLGPWRYRGSIPLVDVEVDPDGDGDRDRERQWRVRFSPSVVHPDLQAGDDLDLALEWPARGVLRAADGTPLPAGHALGTVLGTVGPATAAQAEELGAPYREGDRVGQSGLQASHERDLAGSPAGELRLVRGGVVAGVPATYPARPGRDVRTTLDLAAQRAAEDALGVEGNPAAMVVIRPSTGGIVAVANRPRDGFSRALLGRYAPGSTFKVITTLALLQKGVTPDTRIDCPRDITVNGRTIANAENEELGNISFRDAFSHSCNTAFIGLAQQLSSGDLLDAAKTFGFNTDLAAGTDLPRSEVPEPTGTVDLVSAAIGQSRIQVTPLQMASVAATVANGGYRMPHFVDRLDNTVSTPLPAGTAATLQTLMRLVVSEGTGKRAAVGGAPVSGKTGTAEFGTASPPRTHAWFISFRGDLATAVVVEDAGFGGEVAAPIAAGFYQRIG
jgi:hypothetical protein